jgi:predicted nucleotide-binding protein
VGATSDIGGIVYLSYNSQIDDVKVELYKEMMAVGIHIDPKLL